MLRIRDALVVANKALVAALGHAPFKACSRGSLRDIPMSSASESRLAGSGLRSRPTAECFDFKTTFEAAAYRLTALTYNFSDL